MKFIINLKLIITVFVFVLLASLLTQSNSSRAQTTPPLSDIDGDGIVGSIDARIASPPDTTNCPACVDLNADGEINNLDEEKVKFHLGKKTNDGKAFTLVDLNLDNEIDNKDIDILNQYKGKKLQTGNFNLDNPKDLTYGYRARELAIIFPESLSEDQQNSILVKYNLSRIRNFGRPHLVLASTQTDDLDGLAKLIKSENPNIQDVQKHTYFGETQTNDPYWDEQWGIRRTRTDQAWLTETKGHSSVIVAVLDTGVWMNHPDFANTNFANARNSIDNNSDVTDTVGHGTEMAGIIAATENNNQGIAGVAPKVTIMPVKVLYDYGGIGLIGVCDPYALADGLYWAGDHAADVINMSFECEQSAFIDSALDYASYIKAALLVGASGNGGTTDGVIYPASHERVWAVGAAGQDKFGTLYIHPITDRDPDRPQMIYAPGVDTPALSINDPDDDPDGDGVLIIEGGATSPAAAYFSGIMALESTVCKDSGDYMTKFCVIHAIYFGGSNDNDFIDAWGSVWDSNCFRVDVVHDHQIDVRDFQSFMFHWGTNSGQPLYDARYELLPVGGDNQIDIHDIQNLWGENPHGINCPSRHLHQ